MLEQNKVLDYIIESNIEDKDNLLKIINCIINEIKFNDYNLRKNYIVEIIKKINFIVNENSLIISAGTFKNAMIEKQDEFILRYSTYIYNVLKIFYDQFDDRTYQIDSISNLYQLIVKIEAKNKKDNVVVWETIDSIIIQIRYLKNYFKNLERKINTPEYFDVKKQGLYFLKPILRMLEILDIILEDNKKYYNNVDLVNYSNVKDLTDFLNKMREEILNEKVSLLDIHAECLIFPCRTSEPFWKDAKKCAIFLLLVSVMISMLLRSRKSSLFT